MKKCVAAVLLVLVLAGMACAGTTVDLDEYHCRVCGMIILCFKGDISRVRIDEQPNKLRMLSDRGRRLKDCSNGVKMHRFMKSGEKSVSPNFISRNISSFVVVDGGSTLNQKLREWKCLLCDKKFYSLYDGGANLNIKEWYDQPSHIKSVKTGSGIPQCSKRSLGYFGHVFKLEREGTFTSYAFASSSILDNLYYVQ